MFVHLQSVFVKLIISLRIFLFLIPTPTDCIHLTFFGVKSESEKSLSGVVLTVSNGMTTKSLADIRLDPVTKKWTSPRSLTKLAVEYLMRKHNFSVNYIPSTLGHYGKRLENGTWTGVVGDLITGKADVGCLMARTFQRDQVIDYSFPIAFNGMTFISGHPTQQYSWKSIYWPLQAEVWLLTIAVTLTATLAFGIILKTYDNTETNQRFYISYGGYYLFTQLLEQDKKLVNRENGIRVLVTAWLLFVIVINTAYRSKLISLISFPVLEEMPTTYEELSQTPDDFKVTVIDVGGVSLSYFKSSTNEAIKSLGHRLSVQTNEAKCLEEVVGSTKRSCVMWKLIAKYALGRYFAVDKATNKPRDLEVHDEINVSPVALTYPKNSPYMSIFDWALREAAAFGISEKWQQLDADSLRAERLNELNDRKKKGKPWLNEETYQEDASDHKPLGTRNFIGAFCLFRTGLLCGALVFLFETFAGVIVCFFNYVAYLLRNA